MANVRMSPNNREALSAISSVTGKQEYLQSINGALIASTEGGGLPSAITTGQQKIAVTGTAVQVIAASTALVNGVIITANLNNAAVVTVGSSSVTNTADGTGNGKVLQPGESTSVAVSDLNLLYVNGTAGDWISWIGS